MRALRDRPRSKAKIQEKIVQCLAEDSCSFPSTFNPHPGGQTDFFDLIQLPDRKPDPPTLPHRWIYLRGGVGAGKTMSGAAFSCSRVIYDPGSRGLITANTYGQLETSTIPGLIEFCDRYGIKVYPRGATVEETAKSIVARRLCQIEVTLQGKTYRGSVLVLSAEAFTAKTQKAKTPGAGLQVRWIWADEFSTAERSAFEILNDRLGRGEGKLKGLGVITSTINKYQPYNWTYELFDDPQRTDERKILFQSVVVRTSENKSLDKEYYSSVAAGLTEEHRRIQLESEYVAVTEGRLVSTFRRSLHVLIGNETNILKPDPKRPIHIALDFNRTPATATAWQIYDRELRGLREWYLLESDTFELGESIATWVRSLGHRDDVILYGDASGNQKTANSRKTNWQIIKDALSRAGVFFLMRVPSANPDIQDSVNSLKVKFAQDEVFLHGQSQIELIKDLETVRWSEKKPGEIDKSDLARTHLLDGLRYLCWQQWPYKPEQRAQSFKPRAHKPKLRGVVGT